jgi:hypothetical protein
MPTQKRTTASKSAKKRSSSKKSGSRAASKGTGKRSEKSKSSPGIISKAKGVLGKVLAGAAEGAAKGAVEGAALAGSKATGIGRATKGTSQDKSKPATRKAK